MVYCLLSNCYKNLRQPRLATSIALLACKYAARLSTRGILSYIDITDPANCDVLLDVGHQYSAFDDQRSALRFVERALAEGNNSGYAEHLLSMILRFTGPIERAVVAFESSLSKNPVDGHAHWLRAQLGSKEDHALRIARMRDILAQPPLRLDNKTYLHYGIFKELDANNQTDEA